MFQSNFNPGVSDPNDPGVKRRLKRMTFAFKFTTMESLDPSSHKYNPELDPNIYRPIEPSLKPKFKNEKE